MVVEHSGGNWLMLYFHQLTLFFEKVLNFQHYHLNILTLLLFFYAQALCKGPLARLSLVLSLVADSWEGWTACMALAEKYCCGTGDPWSKNSIS